MLTRRQFLKSSAVAAAALSIPRTSAFAHGQTEGFTTLRRGVGTFEKRGGTIGWLINDEALVVVDAQYPDSAGACWAGLQERTARTIDVLINTHHHGDHTAGNIAFKPHAQDILAHENVPALQRQAAEQRGTLDQQAFANLTYQDTWRRAMGDEVVALRHYAPAHTSGDSVVHFEKANIAHLGDLMFNRMPVYIDLPAGADTAGWITVLEQIYNDFDEDTLFIYGHGNASHGVTGGRADLLVARDYLSGLHTYVRKGMAEGTDLDTLANIDRLPDFPGHYVESWPTAVAANVRAVYAEVTDAQ